MAIALISAGFAALTSILAIFMQWKQHHERVEADKATAELKQRVETTNAAFAGYDALTKSLQEAEQQCRRDLADTRRELGDTRREVDDLRRQVRSLEEKGNR